MDEEKIPRPWSELNKATVLADLRSNRHSEHWGTCYEFVRFFINKHFSQFSPQVREEVVQDVLLSVHKNLNTFRGQSQFTTWLATITRNRAIDILRQPQNTQVPDTLLDVLAESQEDSAHHPVPMAPKNPETLILLNERLQEVHSALEEFICLHRKVQRNRQILQLVLYDGYSQEEAAQKLGVSAPVVGHVVRSARAYVRHKLSE